MTTIFIGGSRSISTIAPLIRPRLDRIIERGHAVVLGDAAGADSCVQHYLAQRDYRNVTVFVSGAHCRFNIGAWSTRATATSARPGTRAFYTAKDVAMAQEATCGLMLWDLRSAGTFANAITLLQASKRLLLYLAPFDEAVTLHTLDDIPAVLKRCPAGARAPLQQQFNQAQSILV
jgi:hypothetical protein